MKTGQSRLLVVTLPFLMAVALVMAFATSLPNSDRGEHTRDDLRDDQQPNGSLPYLEWSLLDSREIHSTEEMTLCFWVHTGTHTSRYRISNPDGLSGFSGYSSASFDQRVLSQSATEIEVEIESQAQLDTRAPYPVDAGQLPQDIQSHLLPDPRWIQSDDPEIVAKAGELVADEASEAEAVESTMAWVRANITYDRSYSLPNDASSVFRNRSATCTGFSNLAVALLRAAGVPARVRHVCILRDSGVRHAIAEVYFPDAGWAISDPQGYVHFSPTRWTGLLVGSGGFHQCGASETSIERFYERGFQTLEFRLQTPYKGPGADVLALASSPHVNKGPIRVTPDTLAAMLPVTEPHRELTLIVENRTCWSQEGGEPGWALKTDSPWLSPQVMTSTMATGVADLTVDAAGMETGYYTSTITVFSDRSTDESRYYSEYQTRTITVHLWLVDEVYKSHLPLVQR